VKKTAFPATMAFLVLALLLSASAKGREASRTFPDTSLYQLASVWTDDEGRTLRLGDLAGKMRLVTLFFGHCESSCPMALGRLKSLEAGLPEGWTRHAGIVLVTLDPGRDDAESLSSFRKRMDFGKEGWTLLRGGPEDTRELAMLLGVAYRESAANGGIEHNSVLVLLDPRGVVVRRYEGADPGPAFMAEIRKALSAPAR
jgi:protein SCO1/2